MAVAYPLINGVRHSWSSLECKFANQTQLGITKLDYSSKLQGTPVRGAGPLIIAHTTGIQETSGSFTMLLEEFNTWNNFLAQQSVDGAWMKVNFDIVAMYADDGLSTIVDTLQGVRIAEVKIGTTESGSADPTTRDCTLTITNILWNGKSGMPRQPTA